MIVGNRADASQVIREGIVLDKELASSNGTAIGAALFVNQILGNEGFKAREVVEDEDVAELRTLVEQHLKHTGSTVAQRVLDQWKTVLPKFVKIMPVDYKKALEKMKKD